MDERHTRRRIRGSRHRAAQPRWVVGVLAMLVVILAGVKVLTNPHESVTVWSAKHALVPGQRIHPTDLQERTLRMGETAQYYLRSLDALTSPHVVVHRIGAGELVPSSALVSASRTLTAPVVVEIGRGQELTARSGAVVQVWVARQGKDSLEKPALLVEKAYVGQVVRHDSSARPTPNRSSVEVYVPMATVAALIEAVNSDARITLIPRAAP